MRAASMTKLLAQNGMDLKILEMALPLDDNRSSRQHTMLEEVTCGSTMAVEKYPGSKSSITQANDQNASSSSMNNSRQPATKFIPCSLTMHTKVFCTMPAADMPLVSSLLFCTCTSNCYGR